VKILLVSARTPALGGKGDQLRGFQFTCALARDHELDVMTTGAGPPIAGSDADVAALACLRTYRSPLPARALGALGALVRGQPAQVGWMMPGGAWRAVRRLAADADVVLALTARSLRGPLPVPVVLDHVDALSLNMRRRSRGPEPAPVRWAARLEAELLRRWERRLSQWVAVQAVISPVDARQLPASPEIRVLPNSVQLSGAPPVALGERDIDVILTGNMAYPPNADAARWLSETIAPALWRRRPDASVWVVGRDAERLSLGASIEVRGDVPELAGYLSRAKVALAPLRIGTGSPNKVLEAMAAGAVVVATPSAVAPFAFPPDAVVTAETGEGLAGEATRLIDDAEAWERFATRARLLVAAYGVEAQRERLNALLETAKASAHRATKPADPINAPPQFTMRRGADRKARDSGITPS
jgi:glycosyltransferase involved in cell wall biosynthesis